MRRKWEFFRLGVLSFQRLGLLPGLGLLLAFLLLIQGTAIYCLVETEKRQPIALTAVCGQNGDRLCDLLREADGVEKTAIAIAFSAQLYL
ncbi:MAG: hypothetical protein MJ075_01125, partial [Oscillospiraceae bacterium]|nr:hypothetical protein [Oscillospiraceae bacterium]